VESKPATVAPITPTHSRDFTFVNWYGTEYNFPVGVRASAVKALWAEWEKSGLGLHQSTISESIDAERDNFRMDKAFRDHPAFGTMIQKVGRGKYKLTPPAPGKAEPIQKAKKSALIRKNPRRIPAKARQKPR
jgi:hypothetical protein